MRGRSTFLPYLILGNPVYGPPPGRALLYASISYERIDLCLQVRVGPSAWGTLRPSCRTVVDVNRGFGVKRTLPAVAVSVPCLPGTREYRTRSQTLWRQGRTDVPATIFSLSSRLTCNDSGAWRYTAVRDGAPRTILRGALRLADPPPGNEGLFDAHHIVPATQSTLGADVAQRAAYLCEIAPNSLVNGVFLRNRFAARAGEGKGTTNTAGYKSLRTPGRLRVYHPSLHTLVHFQALGVFLGGALVGETCNRPLFFSRLALVKQALAAGGPVPRDNSATEQDVPSGD